MPKVMESYAIKANLACYTSKGMADSYLLAHLYRFMRKEFQAIQDFIEVISLDPENEDASHWLTTMLNVQEQSDSMTAFIEDNISC
jgi:hypothetical protein